MFLGWEDWCLDIQYCNKNKKTKNMSAWSNSTISQYKLYFKNSEWGDIKTAAEPTKSTDFHVKLRSLKFKAVIFQCFFLCPPLFTEKKGINLKKELKKRVENQWNQ